MVYRGPGGVNVVINPYFCGKLMEMVLRAALLQMDIEWGKPAANRAVAGRLVRALHDTDIAFLPEMFTTGFMAADTALAEKDISLSAYWLERISGTLSSFDVKSANMKKALLTALGYFVVTSAGSFLAVMKREY